MPKSSWTRKPSSVPYPDDHTAVPWRIALMTCTACTCMFEARLEWPQGQLVVSPEECPGCGAGAASMVEVDT